MPAGAGEVNAIMADNRLTTDELVGLAFEARDRGELRREVLRRLCAEIGASAGNMMTVRVPPDDAVLLAAPPDHLARASRLWFQEEMRPMRDALDTRRVASDSIVYGVRRERLLVVREIMNPLGISAAMAAILSVGGGEQVFLALYRDGGRRFTDDDERKLAPLVPALAVADASLHPALVAGRGRPLDVPIAQLKARERAICNLVLRGCTNPDIASALGLSVNTVRNQLSRLFTAWDVSTRTELANRLMGWSEIAPLGESGPPQTSGSTGARALETVRPRASSPSIRLDRRSPRSP